MANITFTEGSGLQDSIFGKSQEPIKMFLEKRGEAFEQTSMLPELFNMGSSNHWGEKFSTMTAMDGFQPVGENGDYPVDGMQEGFAKFLEHMTWKNSFSLSREIVEDAKLMDLKKQPAGFITSYYRTREKFGAALIGAAVQKKTETTFSGKTFDVKTADGKCLFATNHPSKLGKSNQSNQFSDAFSNDALMAMEAKMQDFRGDNDEVLDVAPTTILIPNDVKNVSGQEEVSIHVIIHGKQIKTLRTTNIVFIGVDETQFKATSLSQQVQVTIRADAADAQKILAGNIRIVADMSGYTQEGTYQVPVSVYVDGYDSAGAIGQYSIAANLAPATAEE